MLEDIIEGAGQQFVWEGDSSAVERVELKGTELLVTYKGGSVYAYSNVSQEEWNNFQQADSKGRFIATEIKPKHPYRKV